MSQNYLIHHGIMGQKWGTHHGPPYPLNNVVSKAIKQGRQNAVQQTTQKVVNSVANKASGKNEKIEIDTKKLAKDALITVGTVAATSVLSKLVNDQMDTVSSAIAHNGRILTQTAINKISEMQLKKAAAAAGYVLI